MKLDTSVKFLKGVGQKRAELLGKLGVGTVGDLLRLYPRTYEDWSTAYSVLDAPEDENVCIRAFVSRRCTEHRTKNGTKVYKTEITDGEGIMEVNFFNNKYAAQGLVEDNEYIFYGKVSRYGYHRSMTNPTYEIAAGGGRIRPIYPQTEGLNSKAIEKLVRTAFELCCDEIEETLPLALREKYCLQDIKSALSNIHFPENEDMLSEAKRRFIFEELLLLQLGLLRLRSRNRHETTCVIERDMSEEFYSLLPFEPTNAQKRCVSQAIEDMKSGMPMNRLLQGDVGSGKTAVAAALIYSAVADGLQCALMAPTEVLAQQHYKTLAKFFENTKIEISLLTGSTPAAQKKKIKAALADGSVNLVVGTHALIQKDVEFRRLGLVITDEQHRFGVAQRSTLGSKGDYPHVLVMSATPIPRTLALIIYGDLDVSVIDEMPKGRQKIDTFSVTSDVRERAYGYVKKHLCEGRQGFVICPLIEEGEMELVAATRLYEELVDGFFRGFTVGLLHGRMKADEKRAVMADFASGKTQLLISTTVIEVGIDVPNAVIMVVENAERFGLSQLHQLRGRIGRGEHKSTCILISDAQNPETVERLKIMTKTADGFKIADEDLRLRGPGDFFGSRQHGLPDLKIADMLSDSAVLVETQAAARALTENTQYLMSDECASLRKAVNSMFSFAGKAAVN